MSRPEDTILPEYHLLGLYRFHAPFPPDVVVRTLTIIARRLPAFFPGQLPVTPARSIPISSPADFHPSLVPGAFTITPGTSVLIPIIGNDGTELDITDDRMPDAAPASILLKFTRTLPSPACLEGLLGDLIEMSQPDNARLTDSETPHGDEVRGRRFEVDTSRVPAMFYWMTWLNPPLLEAAGPEALARLESLAHVHRVAGGALVRLQDEPTRGDDPEWSRRRQSAEDAFGLAALHRRFPRPDP